MNLCELKASLVYLHSKFQATQGSTEKAYLGGWGNGEPDLTIIGKTMAAGDALMTQSRTRQVSWTSVKRCTLRRGTCRR